MANTKIQIKRSGSSGNTPSVLDFGELGLNYYDGYLFYKDNLGQIQKIFSSDSFSTVIANSELLLADSPYSVLTLTSTDPIIIDADINSDTVDIGVRYASQESAGVVTIYDGIDSANTSKVASANSVRTAYEFANTANNGVTTLFGLVDELTISPHTKETTGIVSRAESTILFENSNRRFTISAVSGTFTLYCQGERFHKTSDYVELPNTTGMYYIYYNSAGVLSYKTSFFILSIEAPVAYVYWNATLGAQQFFADERHGVTMDWATHEYLHRTRGAAIASGFGIGGYTLTGNGSANTDVQFDLGAGTFYDEDIPVQIIDSATPTPNTWQQILSTPARIPMFYLENNAEWVLDTSATQFPMKVVSDVPQYNYLNSSWSLQPISSNSYYVTFIVASNNLNYPVFGIIGQTQKVSIDECRVLNFTDLYLPNFPVVEFRPLYKLIFQYKSSYSNYPRSVLVEVSDLRATSGTIPIAPNVSSHSQLTGLSVDDHLQYVHIDSQRTISAVHTFNPVLNSAPFILANTAKTQLVEGLNADYIDGFHLSDLDNRYLSSTSGISYELAIAAYNQANTGYSQANAAYVRANTATSIAQAAYDKANTGSTQITNDLSSNITQYLSMSRTTSGIFNDVYVANNDLYFNPSSGTLTSRNYQMLSDVQLKENVEILNDCLDTINKLNGVSFTWKQDGKKSFGLIAQDIELVLPEIVETGENNNKTVSYTQLIAFLINAIKEQQKQIESICNKIENI